MEIQNQPQFGVSIEISKSTKGIYSWTLKVTDLKDEEVFNRMEKLVKRLNETYPQETEKC